ncbi:type IV secretory system conjugative DNA transfer family protein [Geodermatophilus sp. DF01-2]|uniref:type IV secretory system conjugative DNA transfer family protein n=1 Tax=Geodermatophilus sp. DF01-2 TaxID=2559610 RepID=UPI0010744B22|nr:type IV secretory system conjugative DNA transfer family protein [Geodermatophilus sp. DF01_2]TFV62036.1 type IV secretory system conjugative DNA transfer family protein [Geodermatophilus sp. DF01_2]
MSAPADSLTWRLLVWHRPLTPDMALGVLRRWATDQRSPKLVLEARAEGTSVRYLIGAKTSDFDDVTAVLTESTSGALLLPARERKPVQTAARLWATTRHRAIGRGDPEPVIRAALGALTSVHAGEQLVVQIILGPRRVPLSVATRSSSSTVAPWYEALWRGRDGTLDSEKRTALREKLSDHGFACTVRLGASAQTPGGRRRLLLGLLAAMRISEAPGIRLQLRLEPPTRLNLVRTPWIWPLRLNVREVLALTAWPLGSDDLPGQPPAHPRLLAPVPSAQRSGRVVAAAAAPGASDALTLSARAALHHLHVVGPTGVGKSVLLGRLIEQDIADGRAVVVIEPKGDLVDDVLARIPKHRQSDVVVLDPTDSRPVGFNPLLRRGQSAEVVADNVLSVFKALYAEMWGPRLQDILHACLLTLSHRDDASLVMLPLLLTNPGFRRSLTQRLHDPIGLGPFWGWYEGLSDGERAAVIAPVMNKLRQWLLHPSLRAVLGQRTPAFSLQQVFTERKILLVPLRSGVMGPEAASLLGSMVVSGLWQYTQARAAIPAERRHPVMVYIDEVQDYLHLPTDLGDALAQARGLGVGFTLAHQYLGQLPQAMRTAVLANARSHVCFQLSPEDAVQLAKGHPELVPEDFTALGQYEVYASLFGGGRVTRYASGRTLPPSPATSEGSELRRVSAERYGQPVGAVEASFAELIDQPDTRSDSGRRPRRDA